MTKDELVASMIANGNTNEEINSECLSHGFGETAQTAKGYTLGRTINAIAGMATDLSISAAAALNAMTGKTVVDSSIKSASEISPLQNDPNPNAGNIMAAVAVLSAEVDRLNKAVFPEG